MSRLGKKPVLIPSSVEVRVEEGEVKVKGPKGELNLSLPDLIKVKVEKGKVFVSRQSEAKKVKANHGTIRSLINNMVQGVSEGWSKSLEVVGTGFRVNKEGKDLVFTVGFSHPVRFPIPEGIEAVVEENRITLKGIDRQLVGQVAAQIRRIKPPDPYKGKGIRYLGEEIKLKPGKATKTGPA